MFVKQSRSLIRRIISRNFHQSAQKCSGMDDYPENPFKRTFRILKDDITNFVKRNPSEEEKARVMAGLFPRHADIVIIGGGAMGSSIAYWLKEKTSREGLRIIVIEKDPTYAKCSTCLSVGGLRQQFSLAENIQMSLFGAEFLRTLKKRFGPEADVMFTPHGYLLLADEKRAQHLIDNSRFQREFGAVNEILSKEQLKAKFPWMNVNDVAVGCLGLEKEGWFDPWSLLTLLRYGAIDMGTQYITGEVVDFSFRERHDVIIDGFEGVYESLRDVIIKMPNGEYKQIAFAICIIAAGPESSKIAQLAKVGAGQGMLSVPLPVERRKRYVYRFDCKENPPGLNTPMTIDYTKAYFRRDGLGGSFLCGLTPEPEDEPETENLDVDYKFFDDKVWPIIANRVPAFNDIKLRSAWSGFYEYNYFDENGIIGIHPYYHNLYFATGFSGHGIQQAPAVGRAVAELILDGDFQTIDLTRLGFDRFIVDKPMYETGIY